MMQTYTWLTVPIMAILPSCTLAAIFEVTQKKFQLIVFFSAIFIVIATVMGWYGTFTYIVLQQALTGHSDPYLSPRVQGFGIFISWASSLPIIYLLVTNIASLRSGTMVDRALWGFVYFYGVYLTAAFVLLGLLRYGLSNIF